MHLNKEQWKLDNAIANITSFFLVLQKFKTGTPLEALECMFTAGMYKKYLKDYAKYRNIEPEEFYDLWNSYIEDVRNNNDWNLWQAYIKKYEADILKASKNEQGIVLSTMHRSKGLEWKYVFIVDCVSGITPSVKAETLDDFEEERRLFYVAMTRAEEHLYLYYYCKNNSKNVEPSPYLDEMQQFENEKKVVYKTKSVKKKGKVSPPKYANGDRINHKSFGNGVIKVITEDRYIVQFDDMEDEITLSREWVETKHMLKRL